MQAEPGARGTVLETELSLLQPALPPLVGCLARDAHLSGHVGDRTARGNPLYPDYSTTRGQGALACTSVSLGFVGLRQPQDPPPETQLIGGPESSLTTWVDNTSSLGSCRRPDSLHRDDHLDWRLFLTNGRSLVASVVLPEHIDRLTGLRHYAGESAPGHGSPTTRD